MRTSRFWLYLCLLGLGTSAVLGWSEHSPLKPLITTHFPILTPAPLLQETIYTPPVPVTTGLVTVAPTAGVSEKELNQRLSGLLFHVRWLMANSHTSTYTTDDTDLSTQVAILTDRFERYRRSDNDNHTNYAEELETGATFLDATLTDATLTSPAISDATLTGTTSITALGIGTTSPADVLAVDGAIFLAPTTPAATVSRLYNTGGSLYWNGALIGGAAAGTWTASGGNVYRATGNVGIGTSSPYAALSVAGHASAEYFTATDPNATSTFAGSVGVSGHMAIGLGTNIDSTKVLKINETINNPTDNWNYGLTSGQTITGDPDSHHYYGVLGGPTFTSISADATGAAYGLAGIPAWNPGASHSMLELIGVYGAPVVQSGIVTNAYGIQSQPVTVGGTISNSFGLFARNPLELVGGTIANNYGLYLENQTAGDNNFSIYSAGGINYFADSVGIGTTTPRGSLSVVTSGSFPITDTYAGYFVNKHAGVLPNLNKYGVYIKSIGNFNAGNTKNYGLYVDDVSGADENYGAYISGNVGIGTSSPYAKLSVTGEEGQLNPLFNVASSSEQSIFIVTSDGMVGIGDSTPSYILDVLGSSRMNAMYDRNNANYFIDPAGALSAVLAGNVGIGTTSPYAKLSVTGDLALTGGIYDNNSTRGSNGQILQTTGSGVEWISTSTLGFLSGLSDLSLPEGYTLRGNASNQAEATNALYINNSGYVGIGTTSPSSWLYVDTGASGAIPALTIGYEDFLFTSSGFIHFKDQTSNNDKWVMGVLPDSYTSSDLRNDFMIYQYRDTAENFVNEARFNIDGDTGNIGIGTSSPYAKLSVVGDAHFSNGVDTSGTSGGYYIDGNLILQASSTNKSTLVGNGAGASLLASGVQNTAIGYFALNLATSGDYNTAVGFTALSANVASNNTAFGTSVLNANTTGSANTGIGAGAQFWNVTGSLNTAVGNNTLTLNVAGNANTAVGTNAGRGTFGHSQSSTTLLGYHSGYGLTNGGDNNIFLGYQAGDNVTSGANNLLLGYDIDAPSGTGDNQLSIGNLIFGTGVDGTGTSYSSGNVGIGTSSPFAKFAVQGDAGTNPLLIASSTGSRLLSLDQSGKIAANSVSVVKGTSVQSVNIEDGRISISSGGGGTHEYLSMSDGDGRTILSVAGERSSDSVNFVIDGNQLFSSKSVYFEIDQSTETYYFGNGNVGIGTSSPYAKLSVAGDGVLTGTLTASDITATGTITTLEDATNTFAGNLDINGTATSTFQNGIELEGGCFKDASGTCIQSAGDTNIVVAASDTDSTLAAYADYVANGTNDQVEINAALAAIPTGGGSVYLLEGTYSINDTITITENGTALVGSGPATYLQMTASSTSWSMIEAASKAELTIANLKLDGANGTGAIQNGIQFSTVSSSTIEQVIVENMQDNGIYLQNSNINNLTSNTVNGNIQNGIVLNNSSNNTFIGNTANNNTQYGLSLVSGSNNIITSNIANSNGAQGISLQSSSNNNILTNNNANNNSLSGLYLFSNSDNNTLTSNVLNSNGISGIYLFSSSNNTITNNTLYDNTGVTSNDSIYLGFSDNNLISSNNITDTAGTGYAINIDDSISETNTLVGNIYSGTGATAINDAALDTRYTQSDRITLNSTTEAGYNLFSIRGSSSVALASSTQLGSGDIFALNNSSGNVLTVDNDGHVGVGTTPSIYDAVRSSITSGGGGSGAAYTGVYGISTLINDSNANYAYGIKGYAISGDSSHNAGSYVAGVYGSAHLNNDNNVPALYGLQTEVSTAFGSTGIPTDVWGVHIRENLTGAGSPTNLGGVYIPDMNPLFTNATNQYGVYIEGQTLSTNRFGIAIDGDGIGADIAFGEDQDSNIYDTGSALTFDADLQSAGNRYFNFLNGNLGIGTTTPNSKLTVAGDINIDDISSGLSIMGTRVFYSSTTNDSIAIGELAGEAFNSGTTYNVALGFEAGRYASTSNSDNNNFMGYQAGLNNTGNNNNLFGYAAGLSNSGNYNNLFGYAAGLSNIGLQNNSFGYLAGLNNTGNQNNLFGSQAGQNNTGSNNNLFGYFAGLGNTGSNNNLFGYQAGYANTGDFNEMIGYQTGRYLQSTSTVAIGGEALYGPGSNYESLNNVALGYRAGYVSDDGSGNNILIGYQAADNLTTGNNNIIIGYDIDNTTATADNVLNIGNLIFGTGINGTSTNYSTGNIGIGTSSPYAKLSVAGNVVANSFSAISTTSTSTFLGTLKVDDDSGVLLAKYINSENGLFNNTSDTIISSSFTGINGGETTISSSAQGDGGNVTIGGGLGTGGDVTIANGGSSGGNVYISTVNGGGAGTAGDVFVSTGLGTWADGGNIYLGTGGSGGIGGGDGGNVYVGEAPGTGTPGNLIAYGNVGIGTSTPSYKLTVSNGVDDVGIYHDGTDAQFVTTDGDFIFENTEAGVNSTIRIESDTSSDFEFTNSGTSRGRIFGGSTFNIDALTGTLYLQRLSDYDIEMWNSATAPGDNNYLILNGYDTEATAKKYGRIGVASDGKFTLEAESGEDFGILTGGSERLTVANNGNVGIGTTTPDEILTVAGNIHLQNAGDKIFFNEGKTAELSYNGTYNTFHLAGDSKTDLVLSDNGTNDAQLVLYSDTVGNRLNIISAGAYTSFKAHGAGNNLVFNSDKDIVEFYASNTQSMVIDTNSNVGIGTTSPYAKLSLTATAGQSNPIFSIASSSEAQLFTVTADGDVGIGSSTPGYKLAVLGNVYASSFIDDGVTIGAPDYVFDDPNYDELTIEEIETFIEENSHLPWLTPRDSGPMALSARINEILEGLENLFLKVFELVDWNKEQDVRMTEMEEKILELETQLQASQSGASKTGDDSEAADDQTSETTEENTTDETDNTTNQENGNEGTESGTDSSDSTSEETVDEEATIDDSATNSEEVTEEGVEPEVEENVDETVEGDEGSPAETNEANDQTEVESEPASEETTGPEEAESGEEVEQETDTETVVEPEPEIVEDVGEETEAVSEAAEATDSGV